MTKMRGAHYEEEQTDYTKKMTKSLAATMSDIWPFEMTIYTNFWSKHLTHREKISCHNIYVYIWVINHILRKLKLFLAAFIWSKI